MNDTVITLDPNRTEPAWKDLWDYIQTCDRDVMGLNFPFRPVNEEDKPLWAFHVYLHKQQVNVCLRNEFGEYDSKLNFVFQDHDHNGVPSTVWVVPVSSKGVADYDSDHREPINQSICTHPNRWRRLAPMHGGAIKEIFRDLLIPTLPKIQQQEECIRKVENHSLA